MEMKMNRRMFIGGAMAAGMLGAAGLAGCASSKTAGQSDAAASDGTESYDVAETREYDVVVVGAGGAGMSASTRCAQLGLSTVLLEQHAQTGGTTLFTEGLFAVNSHWQIANNVNPNADWIFTTAMDYHHWYADGSLFRKYIDMSAGNIDWMEGVGIEFKGTGTMCGNTYNTWHQYNYQEGEVSGAPYVAEWTQAVNDAGAETVLGSEGVELVQDDDGSVTGVVAKEDSGYVQYNASRGVILATGGYADNDEMIEELAGIKPGRIQPMGAGDRNGFGIKAARDAGGAYAKSPGTMVFYGGCIPGISYGTQLYCASAFQPFFWVNQDAERFVNEYYAERNFSFSGDAQSMQDRVISIVTKEQMDMFVASGGIFGCGEYIHAGEPLTELWDQYDEQVSAGNDALHSADTIEELADDLGLDASALADTIKTYNEYCANGHDAEFSKDAKYLYPLNGGPYYAFELNVGIFTTVGGMKVNGHLQVLDEDKAPIKGLYAVGCDAGGLYGDAYDVSICEGSCQGFAVFSGKTAAEYIANS